MQEILGKPVRSSLLTYTGQRGRPRETPKILIPPSEDFRFRLKRPGLNILMATYASFRGWELGQIQALMAALTLILHHQRMSRRRGGRHRQQERQQGLRDQL